MAINTTEQELLFKERTGEEFSFFFNKLPDDMSVLYRCHGQVEYVDVVVIQNLNAVFDVSWFWRVCRKLKIGV